MSNYEHIKSYIIYILKLIDRYIVYTPSVAIYIGDFF